MLVEPRLVTVPLLAALVSLIARPITLHVPLPAVSVPALAVPSQLWGPTFQISDLSAGRSALIA